jgi:LTXXQ motif family protein
MAMVTFSASRLSIAALLLAIATGSASAQPGGGLFGPGMMMGPGMMRGPGMWGGRFAGPCDPGAAGLAGWRIDQIERVVRPTDAQRTALDDLRAASTKAAEALASACPREVPQSSTQRLDFMEKRMEAMLQAIKTVRPAFDALYASLSDEQKARLDSVGPRRWGWH